MKLVQVIFFIFFISITLNAKALEKVSLQLHWLNQFQFAGYYMAKEMGYYKDVGLDVKFKKFTNEIKPIDEVVNKRATYGIGRSSLIVEKSKGKNIVLLASIFQSSPLIFLVREDSNISSVQDFIGKKIMMTSDVILEASLRAMQAHNKISFKDMKIQKHSFNIDDLIDRKTDILPAYISNEVFMMKERGVKYKIFDPKNYGFDIYSDILFTSSDEIKNHKQRAIDFKNASLRGWNYAFKHISQSVDLILKKYNTQDKSKKALLYEANVLKKLAYQDKIKLGTISKNKIQRMYDIYNIIGYVNTKLDLDKFILSEDKNNTFDLTKEELEYLKNKKELTVCIKNNWLPYESFENGKFIGIDAEFLKLSMKGIPIKLKTIVVQTQDKMLSMLQNKKCDIKPFFLYHIGKNIPYQATIPYFDDTFSLVTRLEQPFVYDMRSLHNRKMVVIKGFIHIKKYIKEHYPNFQLQEVSDINTALQLVALGKVFGFIGISFNSSYVIQKKFANKLKIVNNFKKIDLGFGILEDDKILLNLLNKKISTINEKQKHMIVDNWIATVVEKKPNYRTIFQMVLFFMIILLVIAYFYNKQIILKKTLVVMVNRKTKSLKNKNHRLQNLNNLFKDLLDSTMEIIIISDENLNIVNINNTGVKILGAKNKKQIIGTNLLNFINKFDRDKTKRIVVNNIKKAYEIDIISLDGKLIHVMARGKNRVQNGKKIRISTLLDMTEIKESQKQLMQQSKLAQMGEMMSMIAHQWRQPLNAISGAAIKLNMESELNILTHKEVDKTTTFIQKMAQKMSQTINDFMEFSKPSHEKKFILLNDLFKDVTDLIEAQFLASNIKIEIINKDNISIFTQKQELAHILINILINARDALNSSDTSNKMITIEVNVIKDYCYINIEDNAGGIPPEIMQRIFEPYFTTKEQGKGTGLGLYMSKKILNELLDGDISVDNTTNGAIFKIKLSEYKINIK